MRKQIALLLLAAPAVAFAQTKAPAPMSAVAQVRAQFEQASTYVLQSAEDMPADKFSFRPTPEVRTFGELIGHVAGSQTMFCAIALGEKPPAEDAVEKAAKSKADLVKAMKASNEFCARAYKQSDAAASATVELFGEKATRLTTLIENYGHDMEHYGNLVTYLRINGLVPPSSKPR
jgi:uncharacterized damage-inducible protein DinB